MMKRINNKKWLAVIAILVLATALIWQTANSDEIKWIAVGMLHNWFSSGGCEIEVGRRHLVADQQDGLIWPALWIYQDIQAAKGLWIGTKDYYDPIIGKQFDYKVIHIGPRVFDENNEFMPHKFEYYGKLPHPVVTVDGTLASQMVYQDELTDVQPDLKCDRMLYNEVYTSIGLTMTRKIYAFSQQYYDNFHIYEYKFKNTGIYKKDGTAMSPIPTLKDVVIMFQYRYAPTRYAAVYGYYYAPQSAAWGHNTVNHVIHPLLNNTENNLRGFFSWHGLHSKYIIPNPPGGDNYGGPNIGSSRISADGFLGAAQFPGIVVIHADKSTTDKSDDLNQPFSTPFFSSDADFTSGNDQFNAPGMQREYEQVMKMGILSPTHAERVGDTYADSYVPPLATGNPGGVSQALSFGPYTIGPDEEITIVLAEGVAGLSREKCRSIGEQWWKQVTPYIGPDNTTYTNGNQFKNAWVFTGKDSIKQTFKRAVQAWQNNLVIDEPPPPPDKFEVTSGGDRIILSWSNSAESYAHFGGYRLYRIVHKPDTTFDLIFECGQGTNNPTIVHSYEDKTPLRGFNYYYYITTFDDGTVNTIEPGKRLESSLFWTRTSEPAYLRRPAGTALADIRIVPNPYQIKNIDYQFGESAPDRIMFFNIPPKCLIKIFTESGELINTIKHTNGSGDESWNLITSSRQVVVSGVYIAYFEVLEDYYDPNNPTTLLFKKGESTYQKFIVIR